MAVKTSNYYGKIAISDYAISMTAYYSAVDCYGVVDLVSRRLSDSISMLFNKCQAGRGVKVTTVKNKINIDLFVVLREGVNIDAVCEAITKSVRYNVETYTGMRVDKLNVNVVGVRV
ncbi:MAG: Asp23/Gls24 family envelope stress response protein [Clostridia bacterium]